MIHPNNPARIESTLTAADVHLLREALEDRDAGHDGGDDA